MIDCDAAHAAWGTDHEALGRGSVFRERFVMTTNRVTVVHGLTFGRDVSNRRNSVNSSRARSAKNGPWHTPTPNSSLMDSG